MWVPAILCRPVMYRLCIADEWPLQDNQAPEKVTAAQRRLSLFLEDKMSLNLKDRADREMLASLSRVVEQNASRVVQLHPLGASPQCCNRTA